MFRRLATLVLAAAFVATTAPAALNAGPAAPTPDSKSVCITCWD